MSRSLLGVGLSRGHSAPLRIVTASSVSAVMAGERVAQTLQGVKNLSGNGAEKKSKDGGKETKFILQSAPQASLSAPPPSNALSRFQIDERLRCIIPIFLIFE